MHDKPCNGLQKCYLIDDLTQTDLKEKLGNGDAKYRSFTKTRQASLLLGTHGGKAMAGPTTLNKSHLDLP